MKAGFGRDEKRINYSLLVLQNAKKINSREKTRDIVVIAVAVLHDIGIYGAKRKYGANEGRYQENRMHSYCLTYTQEVEFYRGKIRLYP